MEIRVIKEPAGVLPELMPEVGAVYRATRSVRRPGNQQYPEFCWIEMKGKKLVLRKGEYEVVAEDPPEEETMHKEQEQEKTQVREALPAAEPPQKRGPKPKPKQEQEAEAKADLMPQDARLAMLRAELEELLDALTAERARSSRLERALLALTLEHYGR